MKSHRYMHWALAAATALQLVASAKSATYYVSPTGNNAYPGTSAQPWKTIQKAATEMVFGDVCMIESGTYREQVTPVNDGVAFRSAPGATVVVSAYEPVTNWIPYSGGIYVAQLSWDLGDENQLLFDGQMMTLARWPNKSNSDPFDLEALATTGTTSSITHGSIPNWNWQNGGVVYFLGKSRWTSWRRPITSAAGGMVGFNTLPTGWEYSGSHSPVNGGEFYLSNILQALDSDGEWYTDRALQKIYFQAPGGGNPAAGEALVRKRTTVFNLTNRTGVTLNGLTVQGGAIKLQSAIGCVVKNCRILYGNHTIASTSAAFVGQASIQMNDISQDNFILRNAILWGAANGIVLKGTNNRVDNNYIGNFNYLGSYATPVELRGSNDLTRNEIFNAGRDTIRGGGNGSDCGYNDIHHSNLINDDCGGIYMCCGSYGFTRIHHNWIHDIVSRDNNYTSHKATGVYLDNSTKQVIVDHNVMWNLEWACIQINWEGEDQLIYNNTLWSNTGPDSSSMGRWVNGYQFFDVMVYNTLANEGEFHYTDIANTCQLPMGSDPFTDFAHQDFMPLAGTCPVDAGRTIAGYTDDYLGSAPDVGAYEVGGVNWVPGPDWTLGQTVSDEMYQAQLSLQLDGSGNRQIDLSNLNAFSKYRISRSAGEGDWMTVHTFTAPYGGLDSFTDNQGVTPTAMYRLVEIFSPQVESATGLMTFNEYESAPHNSHVLVNTVLLNGLPSGVTATVGGDSSGFGVGNNNVAPAPDVERPILFVYADGTGSSFNFSTDVVVPSLWTSSPTWALNNDPSGEQRITGKLNGAVVWTFTNTTASTDFFEVIDGAGLLIDELVIYPRWIGVDNITVETVGP